jgi:para-aminobenzoate synthetase / 4-amino-4-deoxychorismate lyase
MRPPHPHAGIAGAHRELVGRHLTLADVARAVRDDPHPFVLTGRWVGGRTVAGGAPVRVLGADADAFAALDDLPAVPDAGGLAFGGGWVGHLGFALAHRVEALPPSPPARGVPSPIHTLAEYDHALVLDPDGTCWFEALVTPGREAALRERATVLRARLHAGAAGRAWNLTELAPMAPGLPGHAEAVSAGIERIRAGEVFQANLCTRLAGRLEGSALDAWLALMERAPAAYGALRGWPGGTLLSASPELFLRRTGRDVTTVPMKGTRPRGEGGDAGAAELAAAPKDAAEHVMIVDLMRNDLGRVCEYGSIRPGRPRVEGHPGVWQLVTTVEGRLREGVGDAHLLRATFPPGSVTGAPKVQALKVIAAEEATARGAYCGAIGYASPVAGLELSVAIRTLEASGERIELGVGGAVVADSRPAGEVQECLDKAAPLVSALGTRVVAEPLPATRGPRARLALLDGPRPDPALGVFETVAVRDGEPVALDEHVERLAASLRTLYGIDLDAHEVCARARSVARGGDPLRLLAAPDGTVEVEPRAAPQRDPHAPIELHPVLLPGGLGAHKWRDRRLLGDPGGPTLLLCDRGEEVLEAAWATVWLAEGERLVTPPADGRLLPGVRRAAILRDPAPFGYGQAVEERFDVARLHGADAVFLSSALTSLAPARPARRPRWSPRRSPVGSGR